MRGGLAGEGTSRGSVSDVIPPRIPQMQASTSVSSDVSSREKRSDSFAGSVNSDRSSNEGGGSGRVSWVEALLLIKKTTSKKPTVDAMFPKQVGGLTILTLFHNVLIDLQLPASLLSDIVALAMPQQTHNEKDQTVDYTYCFVIRTSKRPSTAPIATESAGENEAGTNEAGEDSTPTDISLADVAPAMAASPFVYCYVAYRQTMGLRVTDEGTVSAMNKQALVVVSLLPIPNLAYSILGTLESTIYHVTHKSSSETSAGGYTRLTSHGCRQSANSLNFPQ